MGRVTLDFVTGPEYYELNKALSGEEFAQVDAATFNPAGLTGPMVLEPHGISQALTAGGSTDSLATVDIAIPPLADKLSAATFRIGWSTSSVTVANTVQFEAQIAWQGVGTDTTKAADETVICNCNPSAIANGYQFAAFSFAAPGIGARIAQIRFTRIGSTDTESADTRVLGVLLAFASIKQPQV